MASVAQRFEEILKEEFAKFDPDSLQYLEQLLAENEPPVECLFRTCWMNLFPKKRRSVCKSLYDQKLTDQNPLPCKEKNRKMQELLREYEPVPVQNIRTVTDYQNEILDLFDAATHEGEESKGRRYIRWRLIRGLEKALTTNFMEKIREKVDTAFYMRHVFSYQLRNIEDGTIILYYKNHGSPSINRLAEAEE